MTNGNKPAYPTHGGDGDDVRNQIIAGGLTKREMFAMAAMQGILANPNWKFSEAYAAEAAIAEADQILEALSK